MGTGSSKKSKPLLGRKSKKKGGDDGCIGNRKVRTILLSVLLIAFFGLAIAFLFDQYDFYDGTFCLTSTCDDAKNAYILQICGAFCCIGSAVFAILLFFINCDDKVGRIAGVGLVIGGILYIIGVLWIISIYSDTFSSVTISDEQKERQNAYLSTIFAEGFLPSVTAILLGLDVWMHFFDDEFKRLLFNLLVLCITSIIAGSAYYYNSNADSSIFYPTSDGFVWIANGYLIIFIISLIYIILYICTCCTCNCKDTACVRLILAVGLIIGGVVCSIGYYIYLSDINDSNVANLDSVTNIVFFYIGYTILIGGVCVVWALDIGLDDMKGK